MAIIKAHCSLPSQAVGSGVVDVDRVSHYDSPDLRFYLFLFAYSAICRSNIHNPAGIMLLPAGDQIKSVSTKTHGWPSLCAAALFQTAAGAHLPRHPSLCKHGKELAHCEGKKKIPKLEVRGCWGVQINNFSKQDYSSSLCGPHL